MRLNLDDNERNAFHYLIGGVVVVILLKGVAFITDRLGPTLTPDQLALRPFQQGYPLLRGELVMVSTSTGLTERLILAIVLSVGITFLWAFLLAATTRALGKRTGRTGMFATRAVLLVTLGWSIWAAFLLPIKETRITAGKLILNERQAAVGDIPWPFTLHQVTYTGHDVLRMEAGSRHPELHCDGMAWVDAVTTEGQERVGTVAGVCAADEMKMLHTASDAAAIMERELR